jgi:hypothetical protein
MNAAMNADTVAWTWFAEAHPHEAYAMDQDKFWEFFRAIRPGVSREKMERVLRETDER